MYSVKANATPSVYFVSNDRRTRLKQQHADYPNSIS